MCTCQDGCVRDHGATLKVGGGGDSKWGEGTENTFSQ